MKFLFSAWDFIYTGSIWNETSMCQVKRAWDSSVGHVSARRSYFFGSYEKSAVFHQIAADGQRSGRGTSSNSGSDGGKQRVKRGEPGGREDNDGRVEARTRKRFSLFDCSDNFPAHSLLKKELCYRGSWSPWRQPAVDQITALAKLYRPGKIQFYPISHLVVLLSEELDINEGHGQTTEEDSRARAVQGKPFWSASIGMFHKRQGLLDNQGTLPYPEFH